MNMVYIFDFALTMFSQTLILLVLMKTTTNITFATPLQQEVFQFLKYLDGSYCSIDSKLRNYFLKKTNTISIF